MPEPQAKGINFRSLLGAVRRVCGPEVVGQMLPYLHPALARQVERETFVTGSWYPLSDFRQLHLSIQRATGRGVELARELGRSSAHDDFTGIYRVLTFVLSPEFLIRRAPAIWNRYFDTGTMTVTARAHLAEARFTGATGFCRVLWNDAIGGSQGVLEACGAKNVKMTILSGGGDEDHIAVKAEWT